MKTEILTLLRETDGYVSGQELCERFGVSRTAVWKAINQLKEAGYEIEAVQNRGYRLVSVPDILTKIELMSIRKTKWIGTQMECFDVVDSTNTRAKQFAEEGAPNGTYVIAERPGIRKRTPRKRVRFASRKGNLYDACAKAADRSGTRTDDHACDSTCCIEGDYRYDRKTGRDQMAERHHYEREESLWNPDRDERPV